MKVENKKTFQIDRNQVEKSVKALWQYVETSSGASLLDVVEMVYLQLGFQKVPYLTGNKTVKIHLDHSLLQDSHDVCLFVKDLDRKNRDYSDTETHFTELLEQHNVTCVTKIIPLKSLKMEYKPYEAKRNLSDMYEFFLADDRIVRLLSSQLGKNFYKKKRHPVQVNLKATDLKKEIDRALKTSQCVITGRGATCLAKVAHTGVSVEQAVANIITAARTLAENIQGGPDNVKTLHIKTLNSPAIPIYVSFASPNSVSLPPKPEQPTAMEPEDVTTVEGSKVVVTPQGDIHLIPDGEEFPRKRKPETGKASESKTAEVGSKESDKSSEEESGSDVEEGPKPKKIAKITEKNKHTPKTKAKKADTEVAKSNKPAIKSKKVTKDSNPSVKKDTVKPRKVVQKKKTAAV